MTTHFKRWHSFVVPTLLLVTSFGILMAFTPEHDQRLIQALLASGFVVLLSSWLLLDATLGRLTMAADGFREGIKDVKTDISKVSDRVTAIERIPAMKRALALQAAADLRERIGGPPTGPDDPHIPDDLLPQRPMT